VVSIFHTPRKESFDEVVGVLPNIREEPIFFSNPPFSSKRRRRRRRRRRTFERNALQTEKIDPDRQKQTAT